MTTNKWQQQQQQQQQVTMTTITANTKHTPKYWEACAPGLFPSDPLYLKKVHWDLHRQCETSNKAMVVLMTMTSRQGPKWLRQKMIASLRLLAVGQC
jgi:hypothetical protein